MKGTVTWKILKSHLVSGQLVPGNEIEIKIDQTLTQDATGTMVYLQFEAMGVPKPKTKVSVSYVDHNMLQDDFKNPDDHVYLQTVAQKYGIWFSKAGNGICHQVHLERFGVPGQTLLGSDSHTPTGGGLGMIAIGAGGLEVASAMAGEPYAFPCPAVVLVKLKGKLRPWVSAKDIILELLRRLTVKGGVGKVFEFGGEGIKTLSVYERASITNMGTELGATASIFPSDEITRQFLKAWGREKVWREILPDKNAEYEEVIEIDLSELEPLIALPHSPDNVKPVREVEGVKVDQVAIGSCTNSSYRDLMLVAKVLKGKRVHPDVSLGINGGSRAVMKMLAKKGYLADIIAAGARILENACGPCIGMGFAPPSGGVSLRTFNRNFEGRSGTKDAKVYLCSPEVAVAAAIYGVITDPRKLGKYPVIEMPEKFEPDDALFIPPLPPKKREMVEIIRGPNIKPLFEMEPLPSSLRGRVLLKVGDNITTDHILPAGAKVLPLRSNIPAISEFTFSRVDENFASRAKEWKGGFVVGGVNYGQGSSREHAAIAPRFLGVRGIFAISYARIHRANLINFGIIPFIFRNPEDYNKIEMGDELEIENIKDALMRGGDIEVKNKTKGFSFNVWTDLSDREKELIMKGSKLNYIKEKYKKGG